MFVWVSCLVCYLHCAFPPNGPEWGSSRVDATVNMIVLEKMFT